MNKYRTSEYSDRSPYRRRMDTEDRRYHLELHGGDTKLPRMAILSRGLDMLEAECREATRLEVRDQLRSLFAGFDPMNSLNTLTIRKTA